MIVFPDPNVETEYTDPNGVDWVFDGTGWVKQCDCPDDSPSADGHFSKVSMLIDGSFNGYASPIDLTGNHAFDSSGTTQELNEQKHGQACVKFGNGNARMEATPASYLLTLGRNPFTVEFWLRWSVMDGTRQHIVDARDGSSASPDSTWRILFRNGNMEWAGSTNHSWGGVMGAADTWAHYAFVKNGSTLTLYVDGKSQGNFTDSNFYITQRFFIAKNYSNNEGIRNGYLDDFRITLGMARYLSDFTPPEELPKGGRMTAKIRDEVFKRWKDEQLNKESTEGGDNDADLS
jgi:hypothetical protein